MQKILLLDLDGTIRQPKSGEKFISSPDDQQPIPGAIEAINYYFNKKWVIIGITNQGGVASGYKTLDNCILEQQYTLKLFPQMQSILFCPDYDGNLCYRCYPENWFNVSNKYQNLLGTYRKPKAGMINHILISNETKPSDCWMIGDRTEDQEAAEEADIDFLWAEIWRQEYQTKSF